ncbi:uncharacterized protein LOC129582154 [Paramacrobiotus metropolitanus]|uniref:uncharacterized protein LOC129582154 n=1 Tax=Paramacrobiotus metropolitanus TaxID=2943436 RepID=UPI002445BA2E|nr:uncharacterized protein LOC129582154 [Paramacrobiotus metropolitanus]
MAHICSLPIRLFLVVVLHRQGKWISAQSSGVTDSLMAELDHTVKTESSQMQYFVTTDARLLIYQTETVRNMQIQQIHGIWCHVLRANDDCSSVLFFSWNVTTVPPKSETSYSIKEIVHFVIVSPRFKPEVSNDAIRNEFDQMLIKQAIWGVNAVDTGNSDPFALIDSVWMYSNDDVKTQLLEELKRLWQKVLGDVVSRLELHRVEIIPESAQEFDTARSVPIKVVFLVFGESTERINEDQAKLNIRQVVSGTRIPTFLWSPFSV